VHPSSGLQGDGAQGVEQPSRPPRLVEVLLQWWKTNRFALGLALLLLITVFMKYGLSLHPNWFRFVNAAALWPDASDSLLAVGDRALLSNVAPSWVAGAIRATSDKSYIGWSAFLTSCALVLPLLIAAGPRNRSFAQLYFLVIAGGAIAPVLLMWVGGYDALLVCGLVIGTSARSRWVAAIGWFVAALTHSAVALPALLLWATFLLLTANPRPWMRSVRSLWLPAGAVALGCLTIRQITDIWGGSTDRFTLFRAIPFDGILQAYAASWFWIIFSGLGITWVLILWPSIRRLHSTRMFALLAAGTVLVAPLIAVDETRITVLLLVPVTLTWIDAVSGSLSPDEFRPIWRRMLVPALLAPIPVVWIGVSYWPHGL